MRYIVNLGKSQLKLNLLYNYSRTRLTEDAQGNDIINVSDQLVGFENIVFNREDIGRIESGIPTSKLILSANYELNKIKTFFQIVRYGEIIYLHPDDGNPADWVNNSFTGLIETRDQTFSPKWISSAYINYNLTPKLDFTIGGNNIFNVFPDAHTHSSNTGDGIFTYSRRVQQFGLAGAYWYITVGLKI